MFKSVLHTLACVLVIAAPMLACAQSDEISFASTEVAPGHYMVAGVGGFGGGNMGLMVGEDYIVMIDDGLAPLAPKLLAHVKETAGRPVNFMINTHVHGDHVGGNAHFAADGTVVFAHDNIRKRLLSDSAPAGGEAGLPVVTFADGVTFHLNGVEARVVHMPRAHTDGDAFIHIPQLNIIYAGDLQFRGLFPFIDLDNGGTVEGFMAAQEALLAIADDQTRLIPGHGELSDKQGLESDLEMLRSANGLVSRLVDAGKTDEEIIAINPLAGFEDDFNWRFITTERMTQTLINNARVR